ncbi:cyclopropane-fatty-acyl-phospholipid synthase-like protein [Leptotrombidium deliense]|uniref:Cyclopropane-fatty-acyl-phospholipid synthase-like protein n=1 Tax=Leptotrombidium deliense TaxID=299467 RepID=A0A443SFD4_9ACAR|nr:cyclopropane-fatty-acyl-phospholipid synthase-like protein [Leptotrombidium deliense]
MLTKLLHSIATLYTQCIISLIYYVSLIFLPLSSRIVNNFLKQCDIEVNGNNKWDPIVSDNKFYCEFISGAFTGIGDAYTKNYFECEDLQQFFLKICQHKYYKYICYHPAILWWSIIRRYFDKNNAEGAYEDTGKGYDEGVFARDEEKETFRTYSCGYWRNATTQDEAFEHNLADDGLFVIECLPVSHKYVPTTVKLFEKYFDTKTWFPYSLELMKLIDGLFVVEDLQNIGTHYARTFVEEIKIMDEDKSSLQNKVGNQIFRATRATYAYFSAELESRHYQVYHLVLSKNGIPGGYDAVV